MAGAGHEHHGRPGASDTEQMTYAASGKSYAFKQGHPSKDTTRKAYDDADLSRAIQPYKFFYPTVSGAAIVKGNEQIGVVPNKVLGILDCEPEQLVFTANSDAPYGPLLLDLGVGPLVSSCRRGR